MKKWLLLGAAALLLLARTKSGGTDIGQLEPVEAVQILTIEDGVRVLTDTGSEGYGGTLQQALENLHSSSTARIFLDTAQYLLVDREAYLEELYELLRPACRVCLAKEQVDLELAAEYLRIHDRQTSLLQYRAEAVELPVLYSKEGRSQLVP